MTKYLVKPSNSFGGEVIISGSKNAALPIISASLLTDETCNLYNVPSLLDISNLCMLISHLGGTAERNLDGSLSISLQNPKITTAPYELVSKLRASFLIMGPLLARLGKAQLPLPGGCQIGTRPIDLHLKGFSAMGAKITQDHGFVEAKCKRLKGAKIYLDFPSVGATENILIAACLAEGETIIENAATEPEIIDLSNFLISMGADIINAGTDTIIINGKEKLKPCNYCIISDRIEAGTFMVASAICKSDLTIKNVIPSHLKPVIAKFREMGIEVNEYENSIEILSGSKAKAVDIKTLPFPGFPTDMQAQFTSLMSITEGTSMIVETIFENRFLHIPELNRMGAKIKIDGRCAIIDGSKKLTGAKVKACDLRAGASLVLAGLIAQGETEVEDIEHIERGYENFDVKLRSLGASIERIS